MHARWGAVRFILFAKRGGMLPGPVHALRVAILAATHAPARPYYCNRDTLVESWAHAFQDMFRQPDLLANCLRTGSFGLPTVTKNLRNPSEQTVQNRSSVTAASLTCVCCSYLQPTYLSRVSNQRIYCTVDTYKIPQHCLQGVQLL